MTSQKDPQGLIKEGKNNFILTFVNKFKQLHYKINLLKHRNYGRFVVIL